MPEQLTTHHDRATLTTRPISAGELRQLLHDDPTVRILDVRTSGEFETEHIPGSFNVPLDTLAEHRDHLSDVHHPVVLVCQSGARATTARRHLDPLGMPSLRVLEGGMSAWTAHGGDVVRGRQRWALDRQVRGVAGTLVLTAMVASIWWPPAVWFAAAIGFGLAFSAVTNTCALGMLLAQLPYNRGPRCDIERVVRSLNDGVRPATDTR